jgi:hypothetical protein
LKNLSLERRQETALNALTAMRRKWNNFFPALMAFRVPATAAPNQ